MSADIDEFTKAEAFVGEVLERASVSREIAHETKLTFETVFAAVLKQGIDSSTTLSISSENRLDGINLKICYEGKRFTLSEDDSDIPLELRLLRGYADKVSQSYRSGYNTIRISVRKRPRTFLVLCGAGILVAIAVYAVMNAFVGPAEQRSLLDNYLFPLEQVYVNAMLMVGAPVVFFSLLKNLSDVVIVSERFSNARKLQLKAITTSIFATLLALVLGLALTFVFSNWRGYDSAFAGKNTEWSFAEIVVSMVPDSIFEPFETVSPVPLIIVALLIVYALISAGKDFDVLKTPLTHS